MIAALNRAESMPGRHKLFKYILGFDSIDKYM